MKTFRHAGIVVTDLERAVDFYQNIFGLKEVRRAAESKDFIDKICGVNDSKLVTVKLSADDGNLVELLSFTGGAEPKVNGRKLDEAGFSHIAFTVDDLDSEYKRLSSKGVKFISSPAVSPDGSFKVVFCKDPEGNYIELVEVLKK